MKNQKRRTGPMDAFVIGGKKPATSETKQSSSTAGGSVKLNRSIAVQQPKSVSSPKETGSNPTVPQSAASTSGPVKLNRSNVVQSPQSESSPKETGSNPTVPQSAASTSGPVKLVRSNVVQSPPVISTPSDSSTNSTVQQSAALNSIAMNSPPIISTPSGSSSNSNHFMEQLKRRTDCETIDEMIEAGREEIRSWKLKDPSKFTDMQYLYIWFKKADWDSIVRSQSKEEKIHLMIETSPYVGIDSHLGARFGGHIDVHALETPFDIYIKEELYEGEEYVAIYFMKKSIWSVIYESVLITEFFTFPQSNLKNIAKLRLGKYLHLTNSSNITAAMVYLLDQALEKPLRIFETTNADVRAVKQFFDRRHGIRYEVFRVFIVNLMADLRTNGFMDAKNGMKNYSRIAFEMFVADLAEAQVIKINNGLITIYDAPVPDKKAVDARATENLDKSLTEPTTSTSDRNEQSSANEDTEERGDDDVMLID